MLRSANLRDYMIHNPVSVPPDTPLLDAVHEILVNKISGICVVDADDHLVGVLSELDCLNAILAATYNESGIGVVSSYMINDVISVSPSDNIIEVAADMLKKGHRRRPVVQNGKLIGQITCRQLLRAVKEFSAPEDPTEY